MVQFSCLFQSDKFTKYFADISKIVLQYIIREIYKEKKQYKPR